jgi:hypothetical protein
VTLAVSPDFANTRGAIARGQILFCAVLIPLEAAQRAIRETNCLLQQRDATLRAHTAESAR